MKILRSLPIICIGLLIAGACSPGRAHELVLNGDFELDIANGWSIDSVEGMTPYYDTLDRDTSFNSNPGYEARVKKYDSAHAMLYQIFDVSTTDLAFGINAKLYAVEYNPAGTYFAAASVVLSYMNSSGTVLGETRITYKTPHRSWASGPTLHLIEAPDSNWNAYSFNVNDELANLPGVNPVDIAKIRVALYDTTNGCWGAHTLARVLADNASVFDMTGISEETADFRAGAKPIILSPVIINRSSRLTFTIENAGASGSIKIFDIHGRMIKDLGSRTADAPVAWSLDDESGNRAAAGIYFVRYESGKTAATHKLIITD